MTPLKTADELKALYGTPAAASIKKVVHEITPLVRTWLSKSRFCILSTVGPEGTDGSPRGDQGPVVTELDKHTLLMPDWRGNNRLDTLLNIVRDGRISLACLVPGSVTVLRINGTAIVTSDQELRDRFAYNGKTPTTVIVISIAEIFTQCGRAPLRSDLWGADQTEGLPTVGDLLAEASNFEEGGKDYDAAWMARAKETLW